MLKSRLLLLAALIFCWPGMVYAQEINEEYAKELLETRVAAQPNSCEELTGALKSLTPEQLRQLRDLYVEDMKSGAGKIVRMDLALSYRYAGMIRNIIDDLLGQLPYDRIVEGELLINDEPATVVSRYDLKPKQGEIIRNVIVGTFTVMPRCRFLEEVNVPYRFYLKEQFVLKIEEI